MFGGVIGTTPRRVVVVGATVVVGTVVDVEVVARRGAVVEERARVVVVRGRVVVVRGRVVVGEDAVVGGLVVVAGTVVAGGSVGGGGVVGGSVVGGVVVDAWADAVAAVVTTRATTVTTSAMARGKATPSRPRSAIRGPSFARWTTEPQAGRWSDLMNGAGVGGAPAHRAAIEHSAVARATATP
ncbi:MAG TPA: hypothetical protein VF855_07010, partial [Acidimicrobiales bacterium]